MLCVYLEYNFQTKIDIMKLIKTLSILAISSTMFMGCMENKKEEEETVTEDMAAAESVIEEEVREEQAPNIVQVAVGNENFTTLVAAVKAADLVETLSGEGPFTVFAPTNAAFASLPEGTVDTLLKPENKGTLTDILTYHVVSGKFDATTVVKAINGNNGTYTVKTVQGNELKLSLSDEGEVVITDAKGGTSNVVMTDVAASNGVIHAIDAVVMPK